MFCRLFRRGGRQPGQIEGCGHGSSPLGGLIPAFAEERRNQVAGERAAVFFYKPAVFYYKHRSERASEVPFFVCCVD
jgi:hypothetical protein